MHWGSYSWLKLPLCLFSGLNETIIPLAPTNRSLCLAVVSSNSHPSAMGSSHWSNECLLFSARGRVANSRSLNTLSFNPTTDIGFRCALLHSYSPILPTNRALFCFLTLSSWKCDGMRDRSCSWEWERWCRGLALSALTGLSQQQVWPHWPREPHVWIQLQTCASTGSFCCFQQSCAWLFPLINTK